MNIYDVNHVKKKKSAVNRPSKSGWFHTTIVLVCFHLFDFIIAHILPLELGFFFSLLNKMKDICKNEHKQIPLGEKRFQLFIRFESKGFLFS